jgi:uncharacterized membrane protein
MKTNQEYKNAALAVLNGNWAPVVVATIVMYLISFVVQLIVQPLTALADPESQMTLFFVVFAGTMVVSLFVSVPVSVGYYNSLNKLYLDGDDKVTANMFKIGFERVLRYVGGMLLMGIYVFFWMLFLVIPGIIMAIAYSLTPFILKDYPELSVGQAIQMSEKMMRGHKMRYFLLTLSFIGWGLLGILTLGIGYIWLTPYMYTTTAAFYQDVKNEYIANGNM